jgi:BirA family biotin operon repressor/biotin-[acetyl-CoA-carboxylase] ligase
LNQQFQLSALVAVASCELLRKYTDDSVCIKWPNDLYWQDRKAGGILIENIIGERRTDASSSRGQVSQNRQVSIVNDQPNSNWLWAVIGVGINVNQTVFGEGLRNPVSLKQITGNEFSPVVLAKELCVALEDHFRRLSTFGFQAIYSSYLSFLYRKGQSVRLRKGNRAFEAMIKTVSNTGRLVIQHAIEEEFDFGEIDWIIPGSMPKN